MCHVFKATCCTATDTWTRQAWQRNEERQTDREINTKESWHWGPRLSAGNDALAAQHDYCLELNRAAGLLRTTEQEGGGVANEMNKKEVFWLYSWMKEVGLANSLYK